MRKRAKRLLSMMLATVMVISLLPAQALAWSNQESSVLLPITDDTVYPASVFGAGDTPVYASAGATSTSLPDIPLAGLSITVDSDNARIQAVDTSGAVVAQTAEFPVYTSTTELSSRKLFLFDLLSAAEYELKLVYGDVESVTSLDLPYVLTVVDAPVITYGSLNLSAGTGASTLRLQVAGYEGDPDVYSFSLIDEDSMDEITCNASHVNTTESSYGVAELTYSLTPSTALTASKTYYLKITATQGELYSSASKISRTAYTSSSSDISVLEVAPNENVVGGLQVKVGGVAAGISYTVTAALGNSSSSTDYLYQGTLTPTMEAGNGVFSFVLTKNGLTLPLSVYGNTNIYISVEDDSGNSDGMFYSGNISYTNQYANLSLEKTAANTYAFELTGCNLLLDIYESSSIAFDFEYYDSDGRTYVQVASCTNVSKSTYTSGNSAYFVFAGTFTTTSELTNGTTYWAFYNDEGIAGTSSISGLDADALDIRSLHVRRPFYFNFDQLMVEATLAGSNGTATASLYDNNTSQVVATSPSASGVLNEDGNYEYLFSIPKPNGLDASHTYMLQFTSDAQTVSSEDYSSYYAALTYDDAVKEPSYYYVEEPIFVGDTTITFEFNDYSMQNISSDYFNSNPFSIVNSASEIGVGYSDVTISYEDGSWYAILSLNSPITFGTYSYGEYSSFEVLPVNAAVLGSAERDNVAKTVSIVDCHNLSSTAIYTGILYDTS